MQRTINRKRVLQLSILVLLMTMSILAHVFRQREVGVIEYLVFSLSYALLVVSSIGERTSIFFLVMNVFFFLGFWGKFTSYLVTGQEFPEIKGVFDIEILNSALAYSSLFAVIQIASQWIIQKLMLQISKPKLQIPVMVGRIIWVGLVFLVFLAVANIYSGFLRVGMPAMTHIPFPFSLAFSWLLGPGAAAVFYLLQPSVSLFSIGLSVFFMLVFSASTLSRNSMMYFIFPLAVAFLAKKNGLGRKVLYSMAGVFVVVVIAITVSQVRWHYYFSEQSQVASLHAQPPLLQVRDLLLNRWVGIEGVLVAMKNVSDDTFFSLIQERSGSDAQSTYQRLAQTGWDDSKHLLFFTMPGPAGLIGFAQSWPLRILAFAVFGLLMALTYFVCEVLLARGLFQSVLVWWSAQFLAQMSLFFTYNLAIFLCYLLIPLGLIVSLNSMKRFLK